MPYGLWQYHGGTNFGRTAGGPFITTSYDYDAPIDEYGEKAKLKFIMIKFLKDFCDALNVFTL